MLDNIDSCCQAPVMRHLPAPGAAAQRLMSCLDNRGQLHDQQCGSTLRFNSFKGESLVPEVLLC